MHPATANPYSAAATSTAAHQYLPYSTTSSSTSRYATSANTWEHGSGAGNPDPRSIPPFPASLGQVRRKPKNESHHSAAYTTSPPERYRRSPTPVIKREYPMATAAAAPRAPYPAWNDEDSYAAQQTESDYWYTHSPREGKRSSGGSPNYAYSKPPHRQSIGAQDTYFPPSNFSASPRTTHHTPPYAPPLPWPPAEAPEISAAVAAQKAVSELFPELSTGAEDLPCDAYTPGTDYYTTPTTPYFPRRDTVISPSAVTTAHKTSVQGEAYFPNATDPLFSDSYEDFESDCNEDTDDETTLSSIPVKHMGTPRLSPSGTLETSGSATPQPLTPKQRRPVADSYDETDALLVKYRQLGVSYKAIKARLNLDEAESTLRGRYRTLTKPKSERLRKPVWSETDVQLLLEAVDPDLPHVKWKQVSDTIVAEGGSYRFGSSTCKKQYLALVDCGRARPLAEMGGAAAAGVGKRRKAGRAIR